MKALLSFILVEILTTSCVALGRQVLPQQPHKLKSWKFDDDDEEEEEKEEEEDAIKRTIIVLYLQYLRHNQLQENYAIHKSSFFQLS